MSINPVAIRAERHTEVGQLVQGSIDILLETWAYRAIEEQPEAKRVHHATLLDHLRDFLLRLGKSLAESHEAHTKQHFLPATQHGEQRWAAGWSLIEVVRDFQILRLVILEFLDKHLGRPLHSREILAIGLALDEAIGASVFMYVKGRDEYLHELEKTRVRDQEQAAQRLQAQTEALKLADQRKNEFLAMLGHELRNPLAPIRHVLQIFHLKGVTDIDVQRGQEVIRRQVEQLTRMVDDLLDVSRITLGKLTLQKETVAVSALVATALETVRPLAEAKHHELIVDVPAEEIFLSGDRLRLSQILINLLTNAAKYTDRGGRILLTVMCQEQQVIFRVCDNGTGISADLLPHIFDPFTQEDRVANRAHGGLGIGLSLVRKLVQLHDGTVDCFSDGPGKGSEFVVTLPLAEPLTASDREMPDELAAGALGLSRSILVVDDNHDSANSLGMLLRLIGHTVQTAYDGASALTQALASPPDVMLLDIGLPGMSGLEVARRVREDGRLKHILLVA
ncbi:MAG TPA: hybrid sensor histidine kinase/response regulator, partial [Gemmataceae bacterium]|nr:hybrid sensor histidine kinase/response regulator [Gemmataceae bacterium]